MLRVSAILLAALAMQGCKGTGKDIQLVKSFMMQGSTYTIGDHIQRIGACEELTWSEHQSESGDDFVSIACRFRANPDKVRLFISESAQSVDDSIRKAHEQMTSSVDTIQSELAALSLQQEQLQTSDVSGEQFAKRLSSLNVRRKILETELERHEADYEHKKHLLTELREKLHERRRKMTKATANTIYVTFAVHDGNVSIKDSSRHVGENYLSDKEVFEQLDTEKYQMLLFKYGLKSGDPNSLRNEIDHIVSVAGIPDYVIEEPKIQIDCVYSEFRVNVCYIKKII